MLSPERPRVLHVLRSFNRGGVETWLLHVLRNTPPGLWSSDFLLHSSEPGDYDAEVRALGGRLHYCPDYQHVIRYMNGLRRHLQVHGPYDVVHSHLHLFSGIVLRAAHQEHVPIRIAQSHCSKSETPLPRRAYQTFMRALIRKHATHRLAPAAPAAAALFGADWQQRDVRMFGYGLDYSRIERLPPRAALKQQLGLPAGHTVIGHVGRFAPEKNHEFIVATFAELIRTGMDAHLLLVGSGPLESEVHRSIEALGLADRCCFAGAHDDVSPFYGAMDLLLFPSQYEGLGLVVLEAQAAAVAILASTAVPEEATVIAELMHRLPLSAGPRRWAMTIREILATSSPLSRVATSRMLAESRFGVAHSVRQLALLYGALSDEVPARPHDERLALESVS